MEGKVVSDHDNMNKDTTEKEYKVTIKRAYKVWQGKNIFFFGGRLVFGPDIKSLILTILLIVTPVILFCVCVSQRLIYEFPNGLGIAFVVIPAVFTAYIVLLLFLTSGRDPGIIPRNSRPPDPEDEGDGAGMSMSTYMSMSMSVDWAANTSGASTIPPTKDVCVNGKVVKVKYCHTCMLYRPPRCSHCSICNNCVERFDHHCPWVGQCIGKRNYRFFFMFVSSTTLLCLYVLVFCCINIRKIMLDEHCNIWKAFAESSASAFLIVYTFIAVWFVGGLTAFHMYLISTNQTTYENFRYRYDGKTNPHNRGFVGNVAEIFFSKIPASRNNFRAKVKDLSFSGLSTSLSRGRTTPKTSIDIETGGKRQAVDADELDDIQSQIGSIASLDRCGTEPRHTNLGQNGGDWEITRDIHALAAEFGSHQGLKDT
ncbi:hypothetical protein MKW98_014408 [Papaver atlanticum]|uniref:S-acyltransferase n=1 Tax=Papaver atlanticum TaxID=357466 RepID=A0AAD4XJ51_9MAGN|nr:hypothetical protein MKW98_014408 [Papaver atlanticum]